MSDTGETVLHLFEEERRQGRQSEDQRAAITSLIIVIVSAIHGALSQTGFSKGALVLTILLILLGIYGIVASVKLYERWQLHDRRAEKLRSRLDELYPDAQIREIVIASDVEQEKEHPILTRRIRLYGIWLVLHSSIVTLGVIYTLVILIYS